MMRIFTGAGPFRGRFARNFILQRTKLLLPFSGGFDDFFHYLVLQLHMINLNGWYAMLMCSNERSSQHRPIIIRTEPTHEECKMRKILKAMLVAYVLKKVKDKVAGRGTRKSFRRA